MPAIDRNGRVGIAAMLAAVLLVANNAEARVDHWHGPIIEADPCVFGNQCRAKALANVGLPSLYRNCDSQLALCLINAGRMSEIDAALGTRADARCDRSYAICRKTGYWPSFHLNVLSQQSSRHRAICKAQSAQGAKTTLAGVRPLSVLFRH
jgi:hypothetical protein